MPASCNSPGCKAAVPAELEPERLCLLHFTLRVEGDCAAMRRETATGAASAERRAEIARAIAAYGELLVRAATSGVRLADEMKARVLNTLLTLINLRENLDRAAARVRPAEK